jgi:hypothetical protein
VIAGIPPARISSCGATGRAALRWCRDRAFGQVTHFAAVRCFGEAQAGIFVFDRVSRDLISLHTWCSSDKILAMIVSFRYVLGWMFNAFRCREDLVLENLALRQQLLALHAKRPRRRLSVLHKLFWVALRTTGMRSSRSSYTGCDAQALRRPRDYIGYVRRNVGLRASIANLNVRRQTIITDADLPIWDISNPRWCEHINLSCTVRDFAAQA